ncbi:hypothetical protein [Streptomyces sp. NRRL F-5123]|uniref:hypothetical protein n=1 Tax=Streptomyces sp. NRRL F-5123 TaxID=1463856 RepID=UPI0004E1BCAA|nr:hypothetical protein [Streptomyces sp. NRRL F-5123]
MGRRMQEWARKNRMKAAVAARERGDSTYVHGLVLADEKVRDAHIGFIEAEGWKLVSMQANPDNPRERWTLVFGRAEAVEGVPEPTETSG